MKTICIRQSLVMRQPPMMIIIIIHLMIHSIVNIIINLSMIINRYLKSLIIRLDVIIKMILFVGIKSKIKKCKKINTKSKSE